MPYLVSRLLRTAWRHLLGCIHNASKLFVPLGACLEHFSVLNKVCPEPLKPQGKSKEREMQHNSLMWSKKSHATHSATIPTTSHLRDQLFTKTVAGRPLCCCLQMAPLKLNMTLSALQGKFTESACDCLWRPPACDALRFHCTSHWSLSILVIHNRVSALVTHTHTTFDNMVGENWQYNPQMCGKANTNIHSSHCLPWAGLPACFAPTLRWPWGHHHQDPLQKLPKCYPPAPHQYKYTNITHYSIQEDFHTLQLLGWDFLWLANS